MPPITRSRAAARASEEQTVVGSIAADVEMVPGFHNSITERILEFLPAEGRLRGTAVSPAWRRELSKPQYWTKLDLLCVDARFRCSVLEGAAAHTVGALQSLSIDGCGAVSVWDDDVQGSVPHNSHLAFVRANAESLRELRLCDLGRDERTWDEVDYLLHAAPRLTTLVADVFCERLAQAHEALASPSALRLNRLCLNRGFDTSPAGQNRLRALAAAVAAYPHASLQELCLVDAPLATETLNAIVDAALQRRLATLALCNCQLSPDAAPVLVRLLGGEALRKLSITGINPLLVFSDAAIATFAHALRENPTLVELEWLDDRSASAPEATAVLFAACVGHASLRTLNLRVPLWPHQQPVVGAMLGALVAANAPALRTLCISMFLDKDGVAPLLDALPGNPHLRELYISILVVGDASVAQQLLAAVRANTSLRRLSVGLSALTGIGGGADLMQEAHELVRSRAAAH
jgi:hypothetical protein